jgi:hypothetical protein
MAEVKNTGDIVIPVIVPAVTLWENVMGGGWEYMSWWTKIRYNGDADWNVVGSFDIWCEDPDDESKTIKKTLNIEDLARGYGLAVANGFHHCGAAIDLEDMDSCSADGVLQFAFFGKLIYG